MARTIPYIYTIHVVQHCGAWQASHVAVAVQADNGSTWNRHHPPSAPAIKPTIVSLLLLQATPLLKHLTSTHHAALREGKRGQNVHDDHEPARYADRPCAGRGR